MVAVSLLGARVPGRAAVDLLEVGPDPFNALLAEVPRGVDLAEVDEDVLALRCAAFAMTATQNATAVGVGWAFSYPDSSHSALPLRTG